MFKEYLTYINDNPEKYWFKRKLYGWGWTPARWQGWVTLGVFLTLIILNAYRVDAGSQAAIDVVAPFVAQTTVLVLILLAICWKTGETPRWQWGIPIAVDQNLPLKGVVFLIENEAGRFLLQQRDEHSKRSQWEWVFPGGGLENGEDGFAAFAREAKEEFGIIVDPQLSKKICTIPTTPGDGVKEVWYAKVPNTSNPFVLSEGAGAGWFTLKQIESMHLGYGQGKYLKLMMGHLLK